MINAFESGIDTQLAEIWGVQNNLHNRLGQIKGSLAASIRLKGEYVGKTRVITESLDEVIALVEAKLQETGETYLLNGHYVESIHRDIKKVADIRATLDAIKIVEVGLDRVYRKQLWSRFFIVNNTNGHIHSSMNCSTCHFDTNFSWLPTLSGLTEKDAVEAHGALLCTVCFPSAPVEWTNAYELAAAEKKAAQCPGSGTYTTEGRRRYTECPHCGEYVSVTSTGKLRAHKPKEA